MTTTAGGGPGADMSSIVETRMCAVCQDGLIENFAGCFLTNDEKPLGALNRVLALPVIRGDTEKAAQLLCSTVIDKDLASDTGFFSDFAKWRAMQESLS